MAAKRKSKRPSIAPDAREVAPAPRSSARSAPAPAPSRPPPVGPRVLLDRAGLVLVDEKGEREVVALRAGAMHYWRLERRSWRPGLAALASMGLKLVETYVPWAVHERGGDSGSAPRYHFDGNLDVAGFLREAHAVGLKAIIRPGPHINAELTDFGVPERVLWDPACQARTPRQNPVMLPAPPRAFPVPSYASKAFLAETARWFAVVGEQLRDLVWPNGPIVLVQVDNEGAFYFRDGIFDQDYSPDAVTRYRELLRERYGDAESLARAYGMEQASFDGIAPPQRYDVRSAEDLPRNLDWAETHEVILAESFANMSDALAAAGLGGVPSFHNLPMGENATALHASQLRKSGAIGGNARGVDLISLDYYHQAGDQKSIVRRTTELAVASDALNHPAFAAEMGAGAPPYFPPLEERDAVFTLLCAMAYGVRGYNLYMAVERDRWLGSPVDREGVMRPFGAFFKKLSAAFDAVDFGALVREVPARLVIPRSVRRLARVMHAFGPASQAAFRVMGGGMRETVLEDGIDFGDGTREPPPMRAARILVAAEHALEEEGIPWAMVDGGDADVALAGARWAIVPTSCGVGQPLLDALAGAMKAGTTVSFAPAPPTRDAYFRPFAPKAARAIPEAEILVGDEATDVAAIRAHFHGIFDAASRVIVRPSPCSATVHADAAGKPRVVFLINPTKARQHVEAVISGVTKLRDLLDGASFDLAGGVNVEPGSVRFCEVVG
jgi:beta-galactosidase